jgi:hypothetical protein
MAETQEKYIGQFYCYETKTFMKWSELMEFYKKFSSYCSRMWLDYCDEHATFGSGQHKTLEKYTWEHHDWLAKRFLDGKGFN